MPTARRHDIDALRVFAFALLILYHVAMVYVADWDFHIKGGYTAEWLQWPMIALNRWRMPLLFMVSGIALGLAGIEARKLRFAASRTWRLLLPLLFGMFVVVVPQAYCEGRANGHLAPGFRNFVASYWRVHPWPAGSFTGWEHGITWNHLWYLAYLWPYTLLLLALLPLLARMRSASFPQAGGALATAGWLALPIAWFAWVHAWLEPRYPENHALFGDWTVHAESLPLFLGGYLLSTRPAAWAWLQRMRWWTLLLAAVGLFVELGLRWLGRHLPPGPLPEWAQHVRWNIVERIARAAYTWSILLAIFAWGRVWLDRPFRWLPYCTEAVFSWYVLHQTLIVALAWWLIPKRLGPVLEPMLVLAGTIAGCLVLHEFCVRRIRWLRPLFGLKPPAARDTRNVPGRSFPTEQVAACLKSTPISGCNPSPRRG